jgi:hypothetical protein
MTENCAIAERQDRGHPTPLDGQMRVAHRIDAPVDSMQTTRLDAV